MQQLAKTHGKDVNEVHHMFYKANCDRDQLLNVLEGAPRTTTWEVLQDLALRDCDSEAYQHVRNMKGDEAIAERKLFLGV